MNYRLRITQTQISNMERIYYDLISLSFDRNQKDIGIFLIPSIRGGTVMKVWVLTLVNNLNGTGILFACRYSLTWQDHDNVLSTCLWKW